VLAPPKFNKLSINDKIYLFQLEKSRFRVTECELDDKAGKLVEF